MEIETHTAMCGRVCRVVNPALFDDWNDYMPTDERLEDFFRLAGLELFAHQTTTKRSLKNHFGTSNAGTNVAHDQ